MHIHLQELRTAAKEKKSLFFTLNEWINIKGG